MSARGVRIVVGEGPSERKGLLRFVVDGEGYDVVAEASTTAELARLMATHRPDVVVLDDGIGATAVGMINEMSPNTKVVLVWPGAVMPVGGAARVEPARVLQDLGPTIERLTGQPSATSSGRGPALIESATGDPDMLKAMLLGGVAATDGPIIEDREPAPVVILPLTPTIDHDELILNVPDAEPEDEHAGAGAAAGVVAGAAGAAALAGSVPAAAAEEGGAAVTSLAARGGAVGAQSALNRRLGNMALGGAAVASALVLALALGGTRVPIDGLSGQAPPPATSPAVPGPSVSEGGADGGENGGGGVDAGDGGVGAPGDLSLTGSPGITLVSDTTPEPPGPPDVGVDPSDIGPGDGGGTGDDGGGGSSIDEGGGGDDHSGGDAGGEDRGGGDGDHDKGGGNDGDGDDHDNGGGNDGDGDDHDNGGGNDDDDNPGHGEGESGGNGGGEPGGNGGGEPGGNGGGEPGGNGEGSGDSAESSVDAQGNGNGDGEASGGDEASGGGEASGDDEASGDGDGDGDESHVDAESNGNDEGH